MEAANDGKGVVFRTKKTRSMLAPLHCILIVLTNGFFLPLSEGNKPSKAFVKIPLNVDRRRTYRFLRKHLGSTDYRQDLKEVSSVVWWLTTSSQSVAR